MGSNCFETHVGVQHDAESITTFTGASADGDGREYFKFIQRG